MAAFTFDYFLQETLAFRDIWSVRTNWDNFGEGDSIVERAFRGWFHLSTSCLDADAMGRSDVISDVILLLILYQPRRDLSRELSYEFRCVDQDL